MPLRHTLRLTVARVVGGAVTVALVGLAVPGQTAAAAAPSYDARTTSASTHASPARTGAAAGEGQTKPTRSITLRGKERSGSRFFVSGKVGPRYVKRFVVIERKFGDGRWTHYNKVRTTKDSRYRSQVRPRNTVGEVRLPREDQEDRHVRDLVLEPDLRDHHDAGLSRAQTTVQVSPPPMRAARRSAWSPGAASLAVLSWARVWSS